MVLDFILNMIFFVTLIGLFNLVRSILKIRKLIKMHKDNPNIQGFTIINGEIKVIEKEPLKQAEPVKELVMDSVCHKEIKKEEAYRVIKDGQEYYFCSWECREQFLKEYNEKEGIR